MKKYDIKTTVFEFTDIEKLPEADRNLIKQAKQAAGKSYSPYSKFKVGAAVLLENGKTIQGNNQENAAYPSGLCAERVALFYANAEYPDTPVNAIAICAYNSENRLTELPIPPCGSCRQVILETEDRFSYPIRIILTGRNKIYVIEKATQLLPLHFDKRMIDS